MGRKSTKKEKNVYQQYREEAGLSREQASDLMNAVPDYKLVRIEDGTEPTPYEVTQMAQAYGKPELCNYHCSHVCEIGKKYVPQVEVSELPSIVLQTVAKLNEIHPWINRLIQISSDGKITEDELDDFIKISSMLDEVSLAADSLNLWIEKTFKENGINELIIEKKKAAL